MLAIGIGILELALQFGITFVYVRPEPKHGRQNQAGRFLQKDGKM